MRQRNAAITMSYALTHGTPGHVFASQMVRVDDVNLAPDAANPRLIFSLRASHLRKQGQLDWIPVSNHEEKNGAAKGIESSY